MKRSHLLFSPVCLSVAALVLVRHISGLCSTCFAQESPPGCRDAAVSVAINPSGSVRHGQRVCYSVCFGALHPDGGSLFPCDIANFNSWLVLPNGVARAVTSDAYIVANDSGLLCCPGIDDRCLLTSPDNCYDVSHDNEITSFTDCPPTASGDSGTVLAYTFGVGDSLTMQGDIVAPCATANNLVAHGSCCEPCSGTCTTVTCNECPDYSVFTLDGDCNSCALDCTTNDECLNERVCVPGSGRENCDGAPPGTPARCEVITSICDLPPPGFTCDDGLACTADTCVNDMDPETPCCEYTPVVCPPADGCFRQDECIEPGGCPDQVLDCRTGPEPVCCPDDGNPCTHEFCNQTTGLCDSTEDCSVGSDCEETPPDLCTIESCENNCCLHVDLCPPGVACCANGESCVDGLACTQDNCVARCCNHPPLIDPTAPACFRQDPCAEPGGFPAQVSDCRTGPLGTCCPDDGNPCTHELCDLATGLCDFTVDCSVGSDCEESPQDLCTVDSCENHCCMHADLCPLGVACCANGESCSDGLACTQDNCMAGCCNHPPVVCPTAPACFRQDPCAEPGGCPDKVPDCRTGPLTICSPDDGNTCTHEFCNQTTGLPDFLVDCSVNGDCEETPPDLCTVDSCENNCCLHRDLCLPGVTCCANGESCNDGLTCTQDNCVAGCCDHPPIIYPTAPACFRQDPCVEPGGFPGQVSDCRTGPEPMCCPDDGNPCTTESCDGATGLCVSTPDCTTVAECDDLDVCTADSCVDSCCLHEVIPCPLIPCMRATGCDPITGCIYVPDCRTGPLAICSPDDGNTCTHEFCNPATGLPDFTVDCTTRDDCNDQNHCTVDSCENNCCLHKDLCLPGVACCANGESCNDSLACTEDNCVAGCCDHPPVICPTAPACFRQDPCVEPGGCAGQVVSDCRTGPVSLCCPDDGNTCTHEFCDQTTGLPGYTVDCIVGADCEEKLPDLCTVDSCENSCCLHDNLCPPGVTCCANGESCDDGNSCTTDTCAAGCCVNTSRCGNGIVEPECGESCDPPGSPLAGGGFCSNDCGRCGNGILDEGEECELGIPCLGQAKPCIDIVCLGIDGPSDSENLCKCAKVNKPNGTIVHWPEVDVCLDFLCQGGMAFDHPRPSGVACGNATPEGICDTPDTCDGFGTCASNYKDAGTVCRAAVDECDVADRCSGLSGACPPDACAVPGTLATDDGNECTYDVCDGHCQRLHPPRPLATPCGNPQTGTCDLPDRCDGHGECDMNILSTSVGCMLAREKKMAECLRGPHKAYPDPSCFTVDVDQDGDIDLTDCSLSMD